MRWLKHLTDTRQDERVARMIADGGHAAYGLWWMVLETIARKMESGTNKCSLRYPLSKWAVELQTTPCNVRRRVAVLVAAGLLRMRCNKSGIELCAPNLLKYRDEWQSRLGGNSGARVKVQSHNKKSELSAGVDSGNATDSRGSTDSTDFFYTGHRLRIAKEEHQAYLARYPGIDIESEYPRMDAKIVEMGKQKARWASAKYVDAWLRNVADTKPYSALLRQGVGQQSVGLARLSEKTRAITKEEEQQNAKRAWDQLADTPEGRALAERWGFLGTPKEQNASSVLAEERDNGQEKRSEF